MAPHTPRRSERPGKSRGAPLSPCQRPEWSEQAAVGARKLLDDRKVVVPCQRHVPAGQAALLPRRRELVGLANQLGQLVEADGHDERRRARWQVQDRAVTRGLGGIEPELVVEIAETDRLEV